MSLFKQGFINLWVMVGFQKRKLNSPLTRGLGGFEASQHETCNPSLWKRLGKLFEKKLGMQAQERKLYAWQYVSIGRLAEKFELMLDQISVWRYGRVEPAAGCPRVRGGSWQPALRNVVKHKELIWWSTGG